MRTNTTQSLITSIIAGVFSVTTCLNLNAQQLKEGEATKKLTEYKTPLNVNGREVEATYVKKITGASIPLASCGNMGVENGWDQWKAFTGTNGGLPIVWAPSTLTAPRFNITNGTGLDPCTPGTAPGAPPVRVSAGGLFGNSSIRLGQHNTSGLPQGVGGPMLCGNAVSSGPGGSGGAADGCTEQISFPLTVTPADTNFIFSYAMFIDEPDDGHASNEQPWAGICIYDANNKPVPCGCFTYAAGSLTGFYRARCASGNGGTIWYKPWTVVGINLAAYVGQTLTVVVSNVDCGLGGHMAHSYWDFACPPVSGSVAPFCAGNQTTISAPASDPANPYTYTWYQNGNLYTGPPNSSSQIINPFPIAGDTFTVYVQQASGCNFWLPFVPQPTPAPVAAFSSNVVCLNNPTIFNNSFTGTPIPNWQWDFGNGVTSTLQNPSHTYSAWGTYTVTLIASYGNGCNDTIKHPVYVHAPPDANFLGPVTGCAPVCNNYADLSTCIDGNITSWQWSFPGGTPSFASSQNPKNICYATPGSYGASLLITSSYGCKDSMSIFPLVTVHPWPRAEFAVMPSVAPTTSPNFNFSDLWSTGVTHWVWDFGDNSPLDSTNTDPAHSYSASATANDFYAFKVCIRVNNQYGCWDTTCHVVELLPEFTFYIPNTVTPNGDNSNETFFGKSRGVKEYNIWLFDRWGNLIWDCAYKGKNTDWDGPMQNGMSSFCQWDGKVEAGGVDISGNSRQLAQEDVYVWKVKLTDIFDKKHTYIGHVSVVR